MSKLVKLVERILRRPPTAAFSDVEKLLEEFEFFCAKDNGGSHHVFSHEDGRQTVVPKCSGKDVKRCYVNRIIELLDLEEWYEQHR